MSTSGDDALDALYSVSLDGFIAARKELASRFKKAGDKDRAAAIAALPKPTPSAWVTNDLHRAAPGELEALLATGARLRSAMRAALTGAEAAPDVGKLQREQRDRVEALVRTAASRLVENGLGASDAVLARVRTNLTTLSTSGGWGPTAPGHMSKDLEPLDVAALAALLELREPPREPPNEIAPTASAVSDQADTDGHREARAREQEARAAEARAAALESARGAEREGQAALDHATRALSDLRAQAEGREGIAAAARERAAATAKEIEELERRLFLARERAGEERRAADVARAAADEARSARERGERDVERAEARLLAATEARRAIESRGRIR